MSVILSILTGMLVQYTKPSECNGHTAQLRGMASTLRMRTAISPGQWQPWTAVSSLLELISMA